MKLNIVYATHLTRSQWRKSILFSRNKQQLLIIVFMNYSTQFTKKDIFWILLNVVKRNNIKLL